MSERKEEKRGRNVIIILSILVLLNTAITIMVSKLYPEVRAGQVTLGMVVNYIILTTWRFYLK